MAVFPQLASRALTQWPMTKSVVEGGWAVESPGGRYWRTYRAQAGMFEWRLTYRDISAEEVHALKGLFESTQGALHPFTFVDPFSNLLLASEDLIGAAWTRDGHLALGLAPENGPFRCWTASSTTGQPAGLSQALSIPEGLPLCLSVRATTSEVTHLRLQVGQVTRERMIQPGRQLLRASGESASGITPVRMEISGTAPVMISEPQLEAQSWASPYKPSGVTSGIFSNCYFAMDALAVVEEAPGRFATELTLNCRPAR